MIQILIKLKRNFFDEHFRSILKRERDFREAHIAHTLSTSIAGFATCTRFGKQSRSPSALLLKALTSRNFWVNFQRTVQLQPIQVFQNMVQRRFLAPYTQGVTLSGREFGQIRQLQSILHRTFQRQNQLFFNDFT
jgi:hypothetical protein